MNTLIYIFRFIYRIKYWLIILPIAVALLVYLFSENLSRKYSASTTVFTGVVSGYNAAMDNQSVSQLSVNNTMDNIINIITSETTLKNVSMRLFAENMIYGDPKNDNKHLLASSYTSIFNRISDKKDVIALIDKSSVDKTVENLFAYEEPNNDNFVYGLFNWNHIHYCKESLSKISVKRLGSSDMLEIKYSTNDPGIAYNTLRILNEEFIKQYEEIRFGETNNVIAFFQTQLDSISTELRVAEDVLTEYNAEKKVINYEEQTKIVAALSRDYELTLDEILRSYNSSKKLVEEIEKRVTNSIDGIRNNTVFLNKMSEISEISSQIASLEPFIKESSVADNKTISDLKRKLAENEKDLVALSNKITTQQYSKEGISSKTYIDQWLTEKIRFQKAEAELNVMKNRKIELDEKYTFFSPIGPTIKRIERDISLKEQTYISMLQNLNEARSRQKNLQMTSATLKIVNPPIYPLASSGTNRKIIVGVSLFGTFIFVLAFFILLEILDRTLRDKIRTELITTGKVIGAFPTSVSFRYRSYYKKWLEIASKNLGDSIMDYFRSNRPNIVNILSTEPKDGKILTAEQLSSYWSSMGLKVKVLIHGVDFDTQSRDFHIATTLNDIYAFKDEDIIITVYPSLNSCSIPQNLLKEANVNILATRANRAWKDTDQIQFNKINAGTGKTPLFILLTSANRLVVENFTGLLPPFTYIRKFTYRFYQLGLTSK